MRPRNIKHIVFSLSLFFFVSVSHAGTAFFVREYTRSDMMGKKICVYNHMGKDVAFVFEGYQLCPISIEL